jgi:hypothetical protein
MKMYEPHCNFVVDAARRFELEGPGADHSQALVSYSGADLVDVARLHRVNSGEDRRHERPQILHPVR